MARSSAILKRKMKRRKVFPDMYVTNCGVIWFIKKMLTSIEHFNNCNCNIFMYNK
jgi:hypothetical protein